LPTVAPNRPWRLLVLGVIVAVGLFLVLRGVGHRPDSASDLGTAVADTFRFASLDELRAHFQEARYTVEDWDAGDRTVPRFYLATVPTRWRDEVAPNLPVDLKKRYFFLVYTPLVLKANEAIAHDRERLLELVGRADHGADEQAWLRALAHRYLSEPDSIDQRVLDELVLRVDAVPPSLALAQAAVESGWSTSRFAVLGNALFGQWTWNKDGITPAEQRGQLGDYKIRSFATPGRSVAAYMHNLNTHRSYADFREARARIRRRGAQPTGPALAPTLTAYSEKGQEYVEMLLSMIRVNGLESADEAVLRDMVPVVLLPVGAGVD
jgi:uncharacterized FlgJ-related protein